MSNYHSSAKGANGLGLIPSECPFFRLRYQELKIRFQKKSEGVNPAATKQKLLGYDHWMKDLTQENGTSPTRHD
jgi:hypothetical protein